MNDQDFFTAISDEIRRRILVLLLKEGELCVCELQHALDMPQPKISRHLGVLREATVLALRREGTWVHYRLHPQLPLWAYRILENLAQGAKASPIYVDDAARLEDMAGRPSRCCD